MFGQQNLRNGVEPDLFLHKQFDHGQHFLLFYQKFIDTSKSGQMDRFSA